MKNIIKHATIVQTDKILSDHSIEIDNGKIAAIYPTKSTDPKKEEKDCLDASGLLVTPGLIDIHIHGCNSADAMDADRNALETISSFLIKHGVTSFYATTITSTRENILAALTSIAEFKDAMPGASLLGAHVEGPFINLKYKGAQNPDFFRGPQIEEYREWLKTGVFNLITIAPELDGMDDLIRFCVDNGVRLAIGHSEANFNQVIHAADLGVNQATHLFNGMRGLHHREPGTAGGILYDDRIYAQIITDGIHLHPAIVKITVQAKGIEKTILITDAMRAAGLPDGAYELGGQAVSVINGAARIANGSLAGSTLTLDQAIRNTMKFTGLDFQTVIQMATIVPARAMGIDDRKGKIAVGADADLAFFNKDHSVAAAMVGGQIKYKDAELPGV